MLVDADGVRQAMLRGNRAAARVHPGETGQAIDGTGVTSVLGGAISTPMISDKAGFGFVQWANSMVHRRRCLVPVDNFYE